ncbi:MAG: hypothetical protein H7240_06600 [Glaciimonas sp.]|nr:hypothetical protein [Glaciimonas sp.]
MVSHHAPTTGSIHPRYKGSSLNACFVSDIEARLKVWQPALWVHGYLHDSFDYQVENTRVVCNPCKAGDQGQRGRSEFARGQSTQ